MEGEDRLVETFEAAATAAEKHAGTHLTCGIGCTVCCMGPFDITPLDAPRAVRGVERLAMECPEGAQGKLERARALWNSMAHEFPGGVRLGILGGDQGKRQAFFARSSAQPCSVLDPINGACLLNAERPVSCRSCGLPLRCGRGVLPPCSPNLTNTEEDKVAAAVAEPDPENRGGALPADATRLGVPSGETIVCAALVDTSDP